MNNSTPDVSRPSAIGGYFDLAPAASQASNGFLSGALRFESARKALAALIRAGRPQRIWMPRYICDEGLWGASRTGTPVSLYSVNDELAPGSDLVPDDEDWIVLVNYFGLGAATVRRALADFGPHRIIVDNAQALFAPPVDCLATIYSLRKFFGLPDGALMVTARHIEPIDSPEEANAASIRRCSHLLMRRAGMVEQGLIAYRAAEESLAGGENELMSAITFALWRRCDVEAARQARSKNFQLLADTLDQQNDYRRSSTTIDGPLCYPYLVKDKNLRARLYARRIFPPQYWPGVSERAKSGSVERKFADYCIPIPCDQRYETAHVERILRFVKQ